MAAIINSPDLNRQEATADYLSLLVTHASDAYKRNISLPELAKMDWASGRMNGFAQAAGQLIETTPEPPKPRNLLRRLFR